MRVPVLGYQSKTAAIKAMMAEGLPRTLIASRVGIRPSALSMYVTADGRGRGNVRNGTPLPVVKPVDAPAPTQVALGRDTIAALRPHAKARGVSVAGLVAMIVDTVACEKLVDAVLDDREGA